MQFKAFENTVGKGEIARNEQFSFPHNSSYPFVELSAIKCKLSSANSLKFGRF